MVRHPVRQQPHQGQRRHRLAAARFAQQRESLARLNIERDAVHDGDAGMQPGDQVFDFEQGARPVLVRLM